jgi:tryptophan-rich sensory protein
VGGGLLIRATNLPGSWYADLVKPSFTPPNWLFAPAWTFLYLLVACAGWRTFRASAAEPYFSVQLDSPFLLINCALFSTKTDGEFNLVWDRPKPQDDR